MGDPFPLVGGGGENGFGAFGTSPLRGALAVLVRLSHNYVVLG